MDKNGFNLDTHPNKVMVEHIKQMEEALKITKELGGTQEAVAIQSCIDNAILLLQIYKP